MINTLRMKKELHKIGFTAKQSEYMAEEWYKITDAQLDKLATKEQVNSIKELLMSEIRGIHRFNTFAMIFFSAFLSLIVYLIQYAPK